MNNEGEEIKKLFKELNSQPKHSFPKKRQPFNAPIKPGAYIILKNERVLHVGKTLSGIQNRLKNHLYGNSSFTEKYLNGRGETLRKDGYTYQYLVVENPRKLALLEAYAIGRLCPEHIGLGT
ncbi:MAG TPA: hypothetical protein EYP41_07700 [Anaerolineae bacterium]|nr:hypothetical protein [Anaerolineae bacterium]HIP73565.1 hypothetical protein [Anaerolineae bacterium]